MSSPGSRSIGHQQEPKSGRQGLLSALPEHLFAILFKHATPVRLRVENALFLTGDVGDGCYRVDDGLLKVTIVSRSGSERILAFLGPGAIVGELSVIDRLPRSASVIAVQDAALSFLSSTNFEQTAKKHPEVYESLVTLLAARLRETDVTIAAGTFLPLHGRVACALLELAHDFGKDAGSGRVVIHQRSVRAILRQWRASRARVSAASSTTGSAANWSVGSRVIIGSRIKRNYKKKQKFNDAGAPSVPRNAVG